MGRFFCSVFLSSVLMSSLIFAPVSSQTVEDRKQPSPDNPHMHIWGTDDLSSCWTHFDGNDSSGSAEGGYGERSFNQGQQVSVDYTCSMQESFKQDLYLDDNGTIEIDLVVNVWSGDCNDNSECKNLTLTLYQGTRQVAQKEFPAVDNNGNDEMISWEVPIDQNTTRWNKSNEEPRLQVEFSWPGYSGLECIIVDCTGSFGMYFFNNEEGHDATVVFPVVNMSEAGPEDVDDGQDEDEDGFLPGFGLISVLGCLAISSIIVNHRLERP